MNDSHGGSDPGAIGNGLQEKDINLDVALRLQYLLEADGTRWQVQMTRSTDVDVSLERRCDMANAWPAVRFVSIHSNSFSDPAANGIECYSYSDTGTAASMRNTIQSEMVKAWPLTNRGNKVASFYVLVNTAMPATLSEMAFITNANDAYYLGNANEREKMAVAHRSALRIHFGFNATEVTDAVLPVDDYDTPFFTSPEMARQYLDNRHSQTIA